MTASAPDDDLRISEGVMLSADMVKELESKYGELLVLKGKDRHGGPPPWEIALRKASRADYKMFRSRVAKGDPDAQEGLVIGICAYPPREELMALLDRFPALPEAITDHLLPWVMGSAEESGKG